MAKGENIFLRKDGRFEARYAKGRDGNGKLIYGFCYGRTYEEAREKVRRAIRECSAGCIIGGKYTFSYYCNSWLMINGVCLNASSFAKYRTDLKNHIQPFFGDKVLYEITSDQVDRFSWMLLHEKNLSEKTVRNILTLFHSIYRYAKKRSGLNLSDLEIIYPKSPRKSVRVLDHQEEETLMEFLADEMDLCKFGVYMALRTGLRIGEVCALKWKDISMNTDTISVCRTVQRIKAPDEDTGLKTKLLVGEPKSDSSCRTLPLMPDLAALCTVFSPGEPETFVLTGTFICMEPRKLQRRLSAYMKECRIEKVHFHTLRHTFATRCIEAGFDAKTLSEILGHSNISVTMNQYVHPNMDLKRESMSRLKHVICL